MTTSNYSATAYLHNSQITTATAKPFLVCCAFISLYLATAYNSGDSSASRTQALSLQPPVQNSTQLIAPTVVELLGTDHTENTFLLLLRSCPLQRERVNRAFAYKRPQRRPHKTPLFCCCVHACCGRYLVTLGSCEHMKYAVKETKFSDGLLIRCRIWGSHSGSSSSSGGGSSRTHKMICIK
jgi:hypothetical protein